MAEILKGIVVLAVEDDPEALVSMWMAMADRGAVVLPAPDATEALDALTRVTPHVLVADMQMPERDGGWLVTEARRQGLLNGVPTLVVTGQTLTQQEVQEAGFDAYLCKPVDPTVLCETVRELARPSTQLSS
jgi:DNA-binding response OmpR family regulator